MSASGKFVPLAQYVAEPVEGVATPEWKSTDRYVPEEDPLQKVPEKLLGKHFCYSRVPGQPRVYVQDRIRSEAAAVSALLKDPNTHIYICGLKGMETGVDEAFADVCRGASTDWAALKAAMRETGRYHVETY